MKTVVVIPNWNGAHLLPVCLAALERQVLAPDQIVVVDNGSRDGSVKLIEHDYPGIDLVKLDKNYGFAGGVNRGIEAAMKAEADYIALLNNDAEPEPQWLEAMSARLESNDSLAVVAAKQIDYDGIIDTTGEEYSIWGTPFSRGRDEEDRGQYEEQQRILAATGGSSLYRASTLEEIGLFDERFFAYYEDMDWSMRARLAGWEVAYEPHAVVWHGVGATSEGLGDLRLYHMYKNFPFLFIKTMPGKYFWFYGWRVFGVFGFKMLRLMKNLKFGLMMKILFVVAINLPRMFVRRYYIQTNREVESERIDMLLYRAPPPTQPDLAKVVQKLHLK